MEKTKSKLFIGVTLALILFACLTVLTACGDPSKIEVSTNFQTVYYVGEALNVDGGKLTYTDEEGKLSIVDISEEFVTGFDTSTYGEKEMTIIYGGVSTTVKYTVYNFKFGSYLQNAQRVVDKTTGEHEDTPVTEHQAALTFNSDFSVTSSSAGNMTIQLNVDGSFTIVSGEETSSGYYENGKIYLLIYDGETTETYAVFEEVTE